MPCLTNEAYIKLPSIHWKSLPSVIRNCVSAPSELISEDENTYYDIDTKKMILRELRSRAMNTSPKENKLCYSADFTWSFFPPSFGNTNKQLEFQDASDNEDESEAFFSMNSNFSHCYSQGATASWDGNKDTATIQSVLDEFRHLEGWPFGLCRRPLVLPPLPNTPADSWMWHRRKSDVKSAGIAN